jgi:hypothetical protein
VGGPFDGLAGGPVGLVGGDAAGGEGGRCWEARVGQERPQGDPDPLGWRIRWESDPDPELLDAAGVERLVAPERQQQLRHAVGEGTEHRPQSAVTDHRRRVGQERIVVGEGHDLDAVGDPNRVAIDRRAEGEDRVQVEAGGRLADAVDQLCLAPPSRSC